MLCNYLVNSNKLSTFALAFEEQATAAAGRRPARRHGDLGLKIFSIKILQFENLALPLQNFRPTAAETQSRMRAQSTLKDLQ